MWAERGVYLVELVLNAAGVQAQAWVVLLHHPPQDLGHLVVVLGAHTAAEVDVMRDQVTTDPVTQETLNLLGVSNREWEQIRC